MTLPLELGTARLRLRRWLPEDRSAFAAINADPRVMAHFPETLTREESDAMADRIAAHFDAHGFGLWAVEIHGVTPFAGFVGLSVPRFDAHFMPAIEIGWRLAADRWGRGYATEGATAVLAFAFGALGLDEVVSFAVPANTPSRRVMERLGMTHDPADDFDHPNRPPPTRRHVLYPIRRERTPAKPGVRRT